MVKIGYIRYLYDCLISKKEYKHFKGKKKKLATHVVLNILYSNILQAVYIHLCVCSKNIKLKKTISRYYGLHTTRRLLALNQSSILKILATGFFKRLKKFIFLFFKMYFY